MSRDIDDVVKEVIKSNKEIHKVDDKLSREISSIDKDIKILQKEVKSISSKIDLILDLLNTLTVFIEDSEEINDHSDNEEYESNEGWIPEINNWEDNYEEEEDN